MIAAFCASLGLVLLVTPLVIRSAWALELYDSPDGGRRIHERPVPRLGGISVFLGCAGVATLSFVRAAPDFLSNGPQSHHQVRFLLGALVGASILFLVGLVDDVRGISPRAKSAAQVVATIVAWYFGVRIGKVALGYGEGLPVGILEIPLLLLWILGVTNAYNFIDGLNGLAGGIAVVAASTLLVAALALGNFVVILPLLALIGALSGFLHYNFPKARLFLGDSGSLSIGFLLAVFSLQAALNYNGAVLVIIPVLAMFVPLTDGLLAIVRRWLRHVPLSGADARHIHHRLLALGITPQRTAIVLWTLAALMAGFGLLIALTAPFVATSVAILGLVGVAVMLIYGTNLLSYHEIIVAGEVLMSAPSRARRVISDQILAMDLRNLLLRCETVAEVGALISESAAQFGFLGMELSGVGTNETISPHDHIIARNWAWKLDYPIRIEDEASSPTYILSIWCSPEFQARPYGAERVARILGPALQNWFVRKNGPFQTPATVQRAVRPSKRFRAKLP